MVKRGESPTGKIYLAAKASGCSSVRELLNKGKEAVADALKLIGTEKAQRSSGCENEYGSAGAAIGNHFVLH